MKRYCVKCQPGRIEYVDVMNETEDGFSIRVTKIFDGYEKIIEESISRHLFDLCLKTGYIYAAKEAVSVA